MDGLCRRMVVTKELMCRVDGGRVASIMHSECCTSGDTREGLRESTSKYGQEEELQATNVQESIDGVS